MAVRVPGLGAPDYKWLLVGLILAMFVLPRLRGMFGMVRAKAAPAPATGKKVS